jgi:hypothetical protein
LSKNVTRSLFLLALFAVAALLPRGAQAQEDGPHSQYRDAPQELRMARAYLNDGWTWEAVRQQDNRAIAEIDAAIHDIKAAAFDDGRELFDHPPIDMHMDWHDRFVRAKDRLKAAREDLKRTEDMPEARQMRNRALSHIWNSEQIVDRAWHTTHLQ